MNRGLAPKGLLIALSLVLASATCSGAQIGTLPTKDVDLSEITDSKFRPGDVWEYKTRAGEENSHLTILRVETSPVLGIIVHIAVDHIKLANCRGGPEADTIPHMPFTRKALDASVSKRIGSADRLPPYKEGYEEWRSAFLKKHAGAYTISVADAVGIAEQTFRRGLGCGSGPARKD